MAQFSLFLCFKTMQPKKKKSIFVCLVAEKVREIGGRSLKLGSIWLISLHLIECNKKLSSILCVRLLRKYGKLEQKFESGSI